MRSLLSVLTVLVMASIGVGCRKESAAPAAAPAAKPSAVAVAVVAAPEPAPAPVAPPAPAPRSTVKSIAVMPLKTKGEAKPSVAAVMDDLLLSSLQRALGASTRIVGKSDIDAMIGFEKTKDMLGCDDVTCAVDMAGALGVETIVSATVGTLGRKYMLSLVWISQKDAVVLNRCTESLGDSEEGFDAGINRGVASLLGMSPPPQPPTPSPQQQNQPQAIPQKVRVKK